MSQALEDWLPWILAILFTVIAYLVGFFNIAISNSKDIFIFFASVSVTLIGFYITILSIMAGLIGREIIEKIIKSRKWNKVIHYIFQPTFAGLFFICLNLVLITQICSFLPNTLLLPFKFIYFFTLFLFISMSGRILYIFYIILKELPNENKYAPKSAVFKSNTDPK
jgi:hypothetical protein